ncbi:MAG: penicillin-binding transpeptidase domain-containing protein [bacterium]
MESSVNRRLILILVTVLMGFVGLGFRLYHLMIVSADRYAESRKTMYEGKCFLPAQRGRILDRQMEPLATDRTAWSLEISGAVPDSEKFTEELAGVLGLSREEQEALLKRLRTKAGGAARRCIPGEKYEHLEAFLKEFAGKYKKEKEKEKWNWNLKAEFPRFYPERTLAANVIGFVGKDQEGLGGIEYKYENRLEATGENVTLEVDVRRKFLPDSDYTKEANVRGADVILTIDSRIQHLVEQELDTALDQTQAKQAMAVVLDPKTGEILAMAALPSFDPNEYQDAGKYGRKCRPITDYFEPGSVVKPFVVAGALERGAVTPGRVFFCENGRFVVPAQRGRVVRDDIHKFGNLTVRDIVVRSSNIGTCKIALQMGRDALYETLSKFGFGSVSGVDLPAETQGVLRPVQSWSGVSMYAIPYGQEMGTNCLVVATAYAILANRGLRAQPHIVKGYRNPTNGLISEREAIPPTRVIDEAIAETVVGMLVGVTEDPEGTGYKHCRIPGFRVAGKTGTAQKAKPTGGYEKGKRIASWAGFFPADDPKVVIYVMVDDPQKGKYGGEVAGSVFARISEGLIAYWGLMPERIDARLATILDKTQEIPGEEPEHTGLREVSNGPLTFGVMPDLSGMSVREAYLALIQTGFRASFDGEGWVTSQETPAGQTPVGPHAGQIVLRSDSNGLESSGALAAVPAERTSARDSRQ